MKVNTKALLNFCVKGGPAKLQRKPVTQHSQVAACKGLQHAHIIIRNTHVSLLMRATCNPLRDGRQRTELAISSRY